MRTGGIVLCGGRSSRMGLPKGTLPFGPELLLPRVVRLLGEVVETIVVVAAPGQVVPPLPASVRVVRDEREGRGPLEGLLAGLTALSGQCDAAYANSCDVPLLVPAFVRRVFDLLGDHDIAVPHVDGFPQPLASVYRPSVLPTIAAMLAEGQLSVQRLVERVPTRVIQAAELADVDPKFDTLRNLNTPAEYLAALAEAGYTVESDVLEALQLAPNSPPNVQ